MANKPLTTTGDEDVVFRRIRGRIVPIKRKRSSVAKQPRHRKESQATGATKSGALFSAGILGGLFAGSSFAEFGKEADRARKASKGLFRKGQHIKAQARWLKAKIKQKGDTLVFSQRTGIGSFDEKFLNRQSKTFTRSAARQRLRATRLSKQGFGVGFASLVAGGFLASQGARKAFETFGDRELSIGEEAISDIGSIAVTGAAAREFGLKRGTSTKAAKALIKKILSKGRL